MVISTTEVNAFTGRFSGMVEQGQSLVRSLNELAAQQSNPDFKSVIEQINHDIQAGSILSEAIRKHPDVFGQGYADSIRQGEVNGTLEDVLKQLCSS